MIHYMTVLSFSEAFMIVTSFNLQGRARGNNSGIKSVKEEGQKVSLLCTKVWGSIMRIITNYAGRMLNVP